MKKKVLLIALALSLGVTAASVAGCSGGKDVNTAPPVDLIVPDAGMKIDGVFDEDVWSEQKWLKTSVVDADDFQNDPDRAQTLIGNAAKVNSTVRFGEKGMYVAFDVTNASGDGVFVNAARDESLNSGVELYMAQADGQISKVKLSPTGELYWQTQDGNSWKDYEGEVSAYLGTVAKNAAVNEEGCGGYSVELFVPAQFMTSVGLDLSALRGGTKELLLNAVLVSSYSYEAESAGRWIMGSQLDNGNSLTSSSGWYVFGGNGADIYSLSFTKTGNGKIMDMYGRDYAVADNSLTLYLKADENYMIKSLKIGEQEYTPEYSTNDFSAGSIALPAAAVQGDLAVAVDFAAAEAEEVSVAVSAQRFGEAVDLEGAEVIFSNGSDKFTLEISGGKATGKIVPGIYTADLVNGEQVYDSVKDIAFMGTGELAPLEFVYDAFKAQQNCVIDDTNDGYVSHVSGDDFYALMNEKMGDSVFRVTFRNDQSYKNNSHMIMYVFGDGRAVIPTVKYQNNTTDFMVEWMGFDVYGIKPLHGWDESTVMKQFNEAYTNGEGVDLTVVRSGVDFFVFVSEHGKPETMVYFDKFTVDAKYAEEMGSWAIADWDVDEGAVFPYSLDEDPDTVAELTQFSVTLPETAEGGSVTADKTTAMIGETITVTIVPDEGMAIGSVKVNGKDRLPEGGKITITYEDGYESAVEVTFRQANPVPITAGVTAGDLSLVGYEVEFSGLQQYTFTLTGNQLTAEVEPGTYTATLIGEEADAFSTLKVIISEDGNVDANGGTDLNFPYKAFTPNLIYGNNSGEIDVTHANDEAPYFTKVGEGKMWAVSTEEFGDSVFTVTVQRSELKENLYLSFIMENGKVIPLQVKNQDSLRIEWRTWLSEFGISDGDILPPAWVGKDCTELNAAFNGAGIDVIFVREGNTFSVYASETGKPETAILCMQFTASGDEYSTMSGHWAIGSNKVADGTKFEFFIEENSADAAGSV